MAGKGDIENEKEAETEKDNESQLEYTKNLPVGYSAYEGVSKLGRI
jgi:hypothetical protein